MAHGKLINDEGVHGFVSKIRFAAILKTSKSRAAMGSRRHPPRVDKLGCSIPVSFLLLHYVWLRLGK